jgi:hypothetical protein
MKSSFSWRIMLSPIKSQSLNHYFDFLSSPFRCEVKVAIIKAEVQYINDRTYQAQSVHNTETANHRRVPCRLPIRARISVSGTRNLKSTTLPNKPPQPYLYLYLYTAK